VSDPTSLLLAALAAAGYSASDVTTAVVVRRVPAALVAFWAHVVAALALLAAALLLAPVPGLRAAAAALIGGLVAGAGAVAYYAALKRGPASVLAPLAAAGLTLPVAVGVAQGERTALLAAAGTVGLLLGIALLAAQGREAGVGGRSGVRMGRGALLLGAGAAVTFGAYFVIVDRAVGAEGGHPVWVAALVVVGSALAAAPVLLRAGGPLALRPPPEARRGLLAVGLFLTVADLALAAALDAGDVALVSVVASSDPALTVLAARVLLAERLSRRQGAGVALALTGLLGVAAA